MRTGASHSEGLSGPSPLETLSVGRLAERDRFGSQLSPALCSPLCFVITLPTCAEQPPDCPTQGLSALLSCPTEVALEASIAFLLFRTLVTPGLAPHGHGQGL